MYRFDDIAEQEKYDRILADNHWVECSVVIGEEGRLITEYAELILFGGYAIAVSRGGGDSGFQENVLRSVSVTGGLFANGIPEVGCCVSSEIRVEMNAPTAEIPRMAQLVPYVRITNGVEYSGWMQKGLYYIDTRETNIDNAGVEVMTIHGYDAMLKAEQTFPESAEAWPRVDANVVADIANAMGITVDARTAEVMTEGYLVQYPALYTCREVLGYIAAMYAGNFIISPEGTLRLIGLNDFPTEDNLLITELGEAIIFGEDRIRI